MNPLRQILLVFVVVIAQWVSAAHAVEHAVEVDGTVAAHTCPLCLTAQDLGAALPSLAQQSSAITPRLVPESLAAHARAALPPPLPSQRGPPRT
ncbi:MAG: hypothetical protein ACM32G_06440 [Betaproteobacteria bacterium]